MTDPGRSSDHPPTPSLVDRLEHAAAEGGGRVVFHLDDEVRVVEAREMYDMARLRAARLRDAGVGPGDRVGVLGPNRPDWLAWAHATWMRGAAIVPLPIPLRIRDRQAFAHQINALATGFDCRRVAAHEPLVPLLADDLVIGWDDVASVALTPEELIRLDDDTAARITMTSGSTALPKGVSRSFMHQNRRDLSQLMARTDELETRYVTYGPFSHSGPSVAIFAFFDRWPEVHLLVPERFARDPGELFRIVGPHGITQMEGASSAYAAALRSIERRAGGVDMSTLRAVIFGYEMIDPDVVERLREVGGRFGLDPLAVRAHYGLSEGGATRTAMGQPLRIDEIDLDVLVTHGVARPPAVGGLRKRVASCGIEDRCEVRVMGPDGALLPDRHVGEVQFRGPRVMQGYVGPGAEDPFADDGWMRTGDAGYLADGELYLTGRIKEVLVQQGKKYHPEDVEWAAAVAAGVDANACVAFVPLDARDGEIVLMMESDADTPAVLEQKVRAAVANTVGITVRSVVVVPPATLPKASSGKTQRLAVRDRYAEGRRQ